MMHVSICSASFSNQPTQIKVINADLGVNLGGVDFVTVKNTLFDVTRDR